MAPVIIDLPAHPEDPALPPTIVPEQLNGPLRLLAGPGTGKTHALVELYAELVRRGLARSRRQARDLVAQLLQRFDAERAADPRR